MQELASSLGISLTNCGKEREARAETKPKPVTLRMAYQPEDQKTTKTKSRKTTKKEAVTKEVSKNASKEVSKPAPANLEVFNTREEGFSQWTEFQEEGGDALEKTVKVKVKEPMEVVVVEEQVDPVQAGPIIDQTSVVGSIVDETQKADVPTEWSCTFCPKKFAKDNFLQNHITNKHTGPNAGEQTVIEWPCTLCPKKFAGEEHLMKHYGRMHNMPNGPQKATKKEVVLKEVVKELSKEVSKDVCNEVPKESKPAPANNAEALSKVVPSNLDVFNAREEGFSQWAEFQEEEGDATEENVKDEVGQREPMEMVMVEAMDEEDPDDPDIVTDQIFEQLEAQSSPIIDQTSVVGSIVDETQGADIPTNVPTEWSCIFCPKKFAKSGFLQNHMTNKHTGPNAGEQTLIEWPCTLCPKKFAGEEHLMKHYGRMHNMPDGPKKI